MEKINEYLAYMCVRRTMGTYTVDLREKKTGLLITFDTNDFIFRDRVIRFLEKCRDLSKDVFSDFYYEDMWDNLQDRMETDKFGSCIVIYSRESFRTEEKIGLVLDEDTKLEYGNMVLKR